MSSEDQIQGSVAAQTSPTRSRPSELPMPIAFLSIHNRSHSRTIVSSNDHNTTHVQVLDQGQDHDRNRIQEAKNEESGSDAGSEDPCPAVKRNEKRPTSGTLSRLSDLNLRLSVESIRSASYLSMEPVYTTNEPPSSGRGSPANPTERDQYGFKKQTAHVSLEEYNEWYAGYKEHAERRKRKWDALLCESGLNSAVSITTRFPPRGAKVKRYIRKGIPADLRGAAWFWYAGGPSRMNKNPGVYEKLWKQGIYAENHDAELIERDLHRTFPDNIHFKEENMANSSGTPVETPMLQSLRRVLVAFAIYVPKIGYCQSLNFIAGLLLLFMDEERAFWMLYIITHHYLPGMHHRDLEGVNIDQAVFMMCVKESLNRVWSKVGRSFEDGQVSSDYLIRLPPVTLVTAAWFMSAFINALPIESVLRVWDCLF